jgi:hypothetical protein
MLNKLHDKMFVAWNRLHIFIRIVILFVAQNKQTSVSEVLILLFMVCPENI